MFESSQSSEWSLPDTQSSAGIEFSQDVVDEGWGMLCSIKKNCGTWLMTKNEYSAGRNYSCDIVLIAEEAYEKLSSTARFKEKFLVPVSNERVIAMSKLHFKIIKNFSIVYLEDCSSNGTFVNGALVGKNQRVILQNHDEICISQHSYKYFVYMERNSFVTPDILSMYPLELRNSYVVSRSLGSGSYGEVKLVFGKRTFAKYAMKVVPKNKLTPNDTTSNEVNILKALNHPHVIKILHVMSSPKCIFIFLEYMEGGDLYNRIVSRKMLNEKSAKWIFNQLARGVEYLHGEGIAHRDLKPENILLSSDDDFPIIKISDFGLSKFFNSASVLKTLVGTQTYVAPEILETRGQGIYSNQVDVWSLGVILYVCLSGSIPFKLDKDMVKQIKGGCYSVSSGVWKTITSDAKNLVISMMTVNPEIRITIKEVKRHPWLQDAELLRKLRTMIQDSGERDENEPPTRRAKLD